MLTIKQVETGIASLSKANAKRSEHVHELLVSITGHIFEHGDTRVADKLVAAFSKGTDKKALRSWLTTYAPVTFNTAEKVFKFSAGKKALSSFDEAYLMSADCIRWDGDTDDGETALNPLDVYARLTRLLKDADKAAKAGNREVQNFGLVADLAALAIKYKLETELAEGQTTPSPEMLAA